jgi:hypothetical protein
VVTGVRIVQHDGIDRVEIELAGDPIPPDAWRQPGPESPLNDPTAHDIPECQGTTFDPASGVTRSALSAVAPTPDGLPAELSGWRFTGDGPACVGWSRCARSRATPTSASCSPARR